MKLTKNCPVVRFAQAIEVKGPFGGAHGQVQMVNVSHHELLPTIFLTGREILVCRFCASIGFIAEWQAALAAPAAPAIAVPA